MTRKRGSITLSLDPEAKDNLEQIAFDLGYTWGEERGNVSRMIEAIGAGELYVSKQPNPTIKVDSALRLVESALETALGVIRQFR